MLANDYGGATTPLVHHPAAPCDAVHTRESRYAVYFVPSEASVWWRFGSAWLGRNALTNAPVTRQQIAHLDDAYLTRITSEPRRYGIHATLKAPLHLANAYNPLDVYRQAAYLATTLKPVTLTPLQLVVIDGFMALSLPHDRALQAAVAEIAGQCVTSFDNLRARADAAELARRRSTGLTPRQKTLLLQWGYPYVFDEFRFHLTLTGRVPRGEHAPLIEALEPMVRELNHHPLTLDALAICVQPRRDAPFVLVRRYGFDGSVRMYRHDSQ